MLFADQVRNRLRLGRSLRATVEPLQPEVHPGNSFSPMGTWRRRFLLMATNGPWNTWGIYFGTRVRIEENISEPLCEIASDEIVGAGGQRVASTRLGALCRRQRKAVPQHRRDEIRREAVGRIADSRCKRIKLTKLGSALGVFQKKGTRSLHFNSSKNRNSELVAHGNVTRITSHQHSSSDCYFRTSMCQKR